MPRSRWVRQRRRAAAATVENPDFETIPIAKVTPRYKPLVFRHPHLIFVAAFTGLISGLYLFVSPGPLPSKRSVSGENSNDTVKPLKTT
jgi:hypothetical protein